MIYLYILLSWVAMAKSQHMVVIDNFASGVLLTNKLVIHNSIQLHTPSIALNIVDFQKYHIGSIISLVKENCSSPICNSSVSLSKMAQVKISSVH